MTIESLVGGADEAEGPGFEGMVNGYWMIGSWENKACGRRAEAHRGCVRGATLTQNLSGLLAKMPNRADLFALGGRC